MPKFGELAILFVVGLLSTVAGMFIYSAIGGNSGIKGRLGGVNISGISATGGGQGR